MVDRQALTSSLEKVLSKPVFQAAIAKALAESLAATFCDTQQDRADLADHMSQAKPPEAFGPGLKVMGYAVVHSTGNSQWDRKRVELLDFCKVSGKYLVRTIYRQAAYGSREITWIDRQSIDHSSSDVEQPKPAESPKQPTEPTINSGKSPEGYRTLKNSSIEPRRLGDLRWNVREKRYIGISEQEIEYANRDNWAACRKIDPNEPPDGWRWLEVGEVMRNGDTDRSIEPIPKDWIGAVCRHKHFALRRNKFEVGQKVVHVPSKDILEVVEVVEVAGDVKVADIRGSVSRYYPEVLAPYIEDNK